MAFATIFTLYMNGAKVWIEQKILTRECLSNVDEDAAYLDFRESEKNEKQNFESKTFFKIFQTKLKEKSSKKSLEGKIWGRGARKIQKYRS